MAPAGGEDREDGSTAEHGKTERTFRNAGWLAQERDSARADPLRDSVDLKRDGTPISQVIHQAQRRKGTRADVGYLNALPLPSLVLYDRCVGVALGLFRDEQADPATTSYERAHDLPTGGVRRDQQETALVGERSVDVRLPRHDHLWHFSPFWVRAESFGETRGIGRERFGYVQALPKGASLAADPTQIANNRTPWLASDRGKRHPEHWRRPAGKPGRATRTQSRPLSPECPLQRQSSHA